MIVALDGATEQSHIVKHKFYFENYKNESITIQYDILKYKFHSASLRPVLLVQRFLAPKVLMNVAKLWILAKQSLFSITEMNQ